MFYENNYLIKMIDNAKNFNYVYTFWIITKLLHYVAKLKSQIFISKLYKKLEVIPKWNIVLIITTWLIIFNLNHYTFPLGREKLLLILYGILI